MRELILLGDSVLDNRPYVGAGEPDVAAQLQAELPDWTVSMRAVDGSMVQTVFEALVHGMQVLDLRRVMVASADYANPIEPSAIGGAKIARAIAGWVRG